MGSFLCLCLSVVSAQKQPMKFEHLSSENGLSQNSVQCIVQDKTGFMWFGTYEGLNRYDGYEFKIYKSEPGNPFSLSNNTVRSLFVDHDGILWLGTDGGLDRYDQQKDRFIHYNHNPGDSNSVSDDKIRWITEDQSGALWIGTYGGGLDQFNKEGKQFIHYQSNPLDTNSLISNYVTCICISKSGTLWITTDGGLSRFDRERNRFFRYRHDPKNPHSISGNDVYRVYEDRTGVLWFGIWNGGLDRFEKTTEQFIHYRNRPENPKSLSNDIVRSFYEDRTDCLWMGTWGGGLNKYDRKNDCFIHYASDPNDPNSLSNNSLLTIYEDRSGIIWLGNDFGGINKYDRGKTKFIHHRKDPNNSNSLSSNTVYSIVETHEGAKNILWFGTHAGGLNKYDPEKNKFTHYQFNPNNPHSISDNNVRTMIVDKVGNLWIGTNKGLNQFDQHKELFTYYVPDPSKSGLTNNDVFSLCQDRMGFIWVGTYGRGLYKFDPLKKKFINYVADSKNPTSISDNIIWSIMEDHAGVLWIGTENGGLNQFDRGQNRFIHFLTNPDNHNSLSSNKILCIHEDGSGILWLGTTMGLNKFDRANNRISRYSETDGLPSNAIQSILEDDKGNLWLGTQKGLSKFDPRTNGFKNFKVSDGLQSNEFSVNACLNSRNGEMYFGGNNGYNTFFPDSIHFNLYIPAIVIEDFQIFNRSVPIEKEMDGQVILEKSIVETQQINLSYRENSFSFKFASLHLASPEENKYASMMEGFDTKWNYMDASRRFASYTNMGGGEYIFRVKGSNSDGVWNETGASIRIIITPPFWKTIWFYIISALFVVSSIVLVYRYRIYRVRMNERILEKKVEERTQELALEFDEHRKAEEALVLQNIAIQSAANAIVITDRNGKIISVNQAFCRLSGYSQEEVIGKNTSILKSGKQPNSFYQTMWDTILSGEVWKGELENKRKDGSCYPEEMTITPVRQAGGEISHFIAIKQDITEQRKLQNQILQSQKIQSIGTLAGGIAHDFNNILGIILGYTNMIEERSSHDHKLISSLNAIEQVVARGSALVQQILTFARKTDVLFEAVNITEVTSELFSMLQQTFPRTIVFKKKIEDALPMIRADRSQIHQVLLNLCVNARDAMPKGGTITIGAEQKTRAQVTERFPEADRPSYVCISVSDTGEGITKDVLRRIFDPFFTTKPRGKGTGLGLSVALGVVEAHHGFIDLESEIGHGTTFRLYIPVSPIEENPTESRTTYESAKKGGTETILLVEDEQYLLDMLCLILERNGYTIYRASDGIGAIATYKQHMKEIALVVTDMGLPGMSGEEEFMKLKEINPNVRVVLISGFLEPEIRTKLLEAGAEGFIQKPFKPNEILGLIRQVIDIAKG